jgi:hypothetical protein
MWSNKEIHFGKRSRKRIHQYQRHMAQHTILTYPQFIKQYIFYTDTSENKLVALSPKITNHWAFQEKTIQLPILIPSCRTIIMSNHGLAQLQLSPRITFYADASYLKNMKQNSNTFKEKNVVTDALSRLQTEELFTLDAKDELPLELTLTKKQAINTHLLDKLTKRSDKTALALKLCTYLHPFHV